MSSIASVTWLTHKTAAGLPPVSAYRLPDDDSPMLIRRGEMCYYPAPGIDPDEFNCNHGISKVQAEAMFCGAAYGWHGPSADPANYDEHGRFVDNGKGNKGGEGDGE